MVGKAATPGAPGLRDDAGGGENSPPFLKLPPELRTTIYRYVVVNSTPIQLHLGDVDRRRSKSEYGQAGRRPLLINLKPHPHPLTLTCRTFYSEVGPLYVVENTFCMSNASTMEKLHVDYITQFKRMMGPSANKVKKVSIDYRFPVEVGEDTKQIWVKLHVLLDEGGVLRIETRAGSYADLCHCGLFHLAEDHSARASDTKLLDFLQAMFNVASEHHCTDLLKGEWWKCKKCGGKRRYKQSQGWRTPKTETLAVW
ncbi:hypothetical protein KC367_g4348 [Hortaea werneckii]|nr:hypothetical protein KC342_g9289 [Hortaea werneckii]KAI7099381.1 hypothetical protein KC339_g8257 [Hortaea werneckii]KAI7239328.1 hypothetical protein KC365_g4137 [Hortaea werneckii]KAI7305738.1 hypothetical protein KC315_g14532 [Hortaea werneckii]KAI7499573.1 hypothetical protein KC367_g4348 [Hortaea werneckii]